MDFLLLIILAFLALALIGLLLLFGGNWKK